MSNRRSHVTAGKANPSPKSNPTSEHTAPISNLDRLTKHAAALPAHELELLADIAETGPYARTAVDNADKHLSRSICAVVRMWRCYEEAIHPTRSPAQEQWRSVAASAHVHEALSAIVSARDELEQARADALELARYRATEGTHAAP